MTANATSVTAMSAAEHARASTALRRSRGELRRRVVQGWSLADLLSSYDLYPEMHGVLVGSLVRWMPRVGERTGERLTRGLPVMLRVDQLSTPQRALLVMRIRNHERRRP